MKGMVRLALVAGLLAVRQAAPARAEPSDGDEPPVAADFRLQLDREGRRGRNAYNNLRFDDTEVRVNLRSDFGLGLGGKLKFEQVAFEPTGKDMYLRNHAIWFEQLFLRYGVGPIEATGGKIHPRFGTAYETAPGLYGRDFGKRYEITEQLGGGIDLSLTKLLALGHGWGESSIRAEVFQADRSFLTESLINPRFPTLDLDSGETRNRWRRRLGSGGVGNTTGFGNAVVSLQGVDAEVGPGKLAYTLGFSTRGAGEDARLAGAAAIERGYVAGASWAVRPVESVKVTPLVEAVQFDNADGFRGQQRRYLTAGAILEWRNYTLSYVYQEQHDRGGAQVPGRAVQHAAGLDIDLSEALPTRLFPDLTLLLGWRNRREMGERANTYGIGVAWGYKWGVTAKDKPSEK